MKIGQRRTVSLVIGITRGLTLFLWPFPMKSFDASLIERWQMMHGISLRLPTRILRRLSLPNFEYYHLGLRRSNRR